MRATRNSMFIFFLGLFANLGFFLGLLVLVSAVIYIMQGLVRVLPGDVDLCYGDCNTSMKILLCLYVKGGGVW